MREKAFFVNLKSESSSALAYKIGLIVKEIEGRTMKRSIAIEGKYSRAIDKPKKRKLSSEEVKVKIKRWANNKNLKISKCLTIMNQYNWNMSISMWKKAMKDTILISNPELFVVNLTKQPYERTWINSKGEQKKASDYGNILIIDKNQVKLNPEYAKEIKNYW